MSLNAQQDIQSALGGGIGQTLNTASGYWRTGTVKERLAAAVKDAEAKLKVLQEAKEIFDRNPDMERLLNLMQKGYF